jgi:ABC-type phosphate transport system auxiliary subunit
MMDRQQRNLTIYADRQSGLTFAEVGRRYSLSRETIRAICARLERIKEVTLRKEAKTAADQAALDELNHKFAELDARLEVINDALKELTPILTWSIEDLYLSVRTYNVLNNMACRIATFR